MFLRHLCCRNYSSLANTNVFKIFNGNSARKVLSNRPVLSQGLLQNVRKTTTDATVKKNFVWFSDVSSHGRKIVGVWLLGCSAMCFGAVVIGGITRLTESGLSMTQWHLVKGMKPPRTDKEWEDEFERYKTFPEYKFVHTELTLEGFKNIFFWEYLHRMWGRQIGLFFFLPMLYFSARGYLTKPMKPRVAVYGTLLLFQGLLGWYMVKSGLEEKPGANDVPRVSQYRLAAHLSSALVLYSLFLWSGLTHILPQISIPETTQLMRLRKAAHGTMGLVFLTACSGAFVAGLDAGLVYNTYPKFADRWIPSDLLAFSPKIRNITENPTTVQFNHRHLAEFTGLVVLGLHYMTRQVPLPARTRRAATCLLGMVFIQIGLGIGTLLSQAHIHAAATHQAGSVVLLSFALWLAHELRRIPK